MFERLLPFCAVWFIGWGMSDNEKDKNGLKPTQKKIISDAWYNFLMNTNLLDQLENKPRGWSWFWGLYRLYNYPGMLNQPADFNLKAIRDELPAEHWLKDVDDSELNAILDKNDDLMLPHVQSLVDVFRSGMGITSTIYFYDLSFDKISDFSNLIFPLNVIFEEITFIDDVSFNNSIFLGSAYFIKANFPEEVNFRNAVFHGETAKFSGAVFNKIADFTNATFKRYANFKGSTFNGRTTFQRAKFKLHALRFYGVNLNNEIIWTGIERPTLWKNEDDRIDKSGEWLSYQDGHAKYKKRVTENQNAYETLAYLMDKQEKYHDQHFFFRQEMRCRRNLEWFFIKPFYWLYQIFADYGYGIGWAFSWWVANITGGSVILMYLINDCWGYRDLEYWKNLSCSISISLSNATPFAFISFKETSLMKCYEKLDHIDPVLISTIKVTQTVLGILFLFLLLTTLRVRFRIK